MPNAYPDALRAVISEFVSLLQEHHCERLAAEPHAIDHLVLEVLRDVGRGAAQELFAQQARIAVETAREEARATGTSLRVERSPVIEFTSVFGLIRLRSPYLLPAGRQSLPAVSTCIEDTAVRGLRPVNDRLKVRGGGHTVQLQRVLADFGLDASFEDAAEKVLEHYGLQIHRTTVRRTVLKHGEVAEQEATFKSMSPVPRASKVGKPILVEMDGSCVRTGALVPTGSAERTPKRHLPVRKRVTEWRDLRLGFVRLLDGEEAIFVGGILPLCDVADGLRCEAVGLGWTPSTDATRISDGGHGVREALDRTFHVGRHILDRPHFEHHLFQAAEAMGLEPAAAKATARGWSARVARGEVDAMIAFLRAYDGRGKDRASTLADYLERFRDAVHYDEFVRLGYPIGSGEIESAHKSQVQIRMKLPGTWWTVANANRLLALRLRRTNRRWEDHWRSAA